MSNAALVHSRALCESEHVGAGTRVWPFAQIQEGARVGRDCNICGGTFIESGAVLGDGVTLKNGVFVWNLVTIADDCFIGPGVTFTNVRRPRATRRTDPHDLVPTVVHRGSTLGANATILCGIEIGEHALVGAGAVVARTVPPHAAVVGNPARHVGWVCACGNPLDADLRCTDCHRLYAASPVSEAGLVLDSPSYPGHSVE